MARFLCDKIYAYLRKKKDQYIPYYHELNAGKGFLTSNLQYVDRANAAKIATLANQLKPSVTTNYLLTAQLAEIDNDSYADAVLRAGFILL